MLKQTLGLSLFTVVILLLTSCNKHESPISEDEILARVGEEIITAREFQLNYEFGFPHLLQGETRKQEYLYRMIAELLIAQHGYELKIDTLSSIRNAVQTMREERVIEEVFNHYVLSQIEITPEEIEYEVNKSAVSIQFQYLPAGSRLQAQRLHDELMEDSFENVVVRYISDVFDFDEEDDIAEQFTSRVTKAVDLDPELLHHLQDLDIHTPSKPIEYQGQWYVLMVHNIIRSPLTPLDIANRSVSARKVIYNTKAMQMAASFVSDTMTPLQVETNRATFDKLVPHLYDLYSENIPVGTLWNRIRDGRTHTEFYGQLYALRTLPLVYTAKGTWTVEKFFQTYNTGRYQLRPDSFEEFSLRFSDIIALVVRDEVFLEMANKERLTDRFEVTRDIKRWEQKWVFQQTRGIILDTITFNNEAVMQFVNSDRSTYPDHIRGLQFEEYQEGTIHQFRRDYLAQALMDAADVFKQEHQVQINYTMLDTITVSESSKNPNMTFQVFNQNSNRMAWPVLDPIW